MLLLMIFIMLRVVFLGTGGALPTVNRNPSSILVNREGELLLFDCGEGTQQQMMRARTGMMSLSSIFITHFHADHVLGIPGLLQTLSFHGRDAPLTIYGPAWVEQFVKLISLLGYCRLNFEIKAVPLEAGDTVHREGYVINAIASEHSVPSLAYALVENERPGRFDRRRAEELGVPVGPLYSRLQKGESVEVNGRLVHPNEVIGPCRRGRKLIYTGDTRPCEAIIRASKNADVLIHDGTLAQEKVDWARESLHSTAKEAADVAQKAEVQRLILTHISSRYTDDSSVLLEEAKEVFENTCVADDLVEFEVPYGK